MKKKTLIITLVFALIVFIIYFTTTKDNAEQLNEIRIGAVLPLTGDVASYGIDSKNGIDLAISLANSAQNEYLFTVSYEDSKGEPKTAVNATEKLIVSEHPIAIIGENISSSTAAMIPIIDRNKLLLISPSASAPNLSGLSNYFFRVFPSDVEEGAFIAKTVSTIHPNSQAVVIYVNNDYGVGLKSIFEEKSDLLGINILDTFGFVKGTTDFKSILSRVKLLNPDVIYMPSYYEEGGALLKQIREMDIKANVFGSTTHEDPKLIDIAGNAANGLIFPVSTGYNPESNNDIVKNFIDSFLITYNKEPGLVSALGYDCAQLIIDGVRTGGATTDGIRNFILNSQSIPGAAGNMSFDKNGDVHKQIILKSIIEGSFLEYKNGS